MVASDRRIGGTGLGERLAAMPDARLVERAAEGDLDAFETLVRPRLDRLFRLAVAILRSEPDARDAVQEACLHAWTHLPTLRDAERFDPWLTRIVVNAARSLVRSQRRVRVREVALDDTFVADPGREPATHGPIGELGEVEAIRAAFDRLGADARALLVLHYVEGRPIAEIGALSGTPVGTIKWRLWRARRVLERALKAERR